MAKRRTARSEICITVEKAGVWLYGNREAFQSLAKSMSGLAASVPAEHEELHVALQLGSSFSKKDPVFILMDPEARRVHDRETFDVTFMVVEPADLKRLRQQERKGLLPKGWVRQ